MLEGVDAVGKDGTQRLKVWGSLLKGPVAVRKTPPYVFVMFTPRCCLYAVQGRHSTMLSCVTLFKGFQCTMGRVAM